MPVHAARRRRISVLAIPFLLAACADDTLTAPTVRAPGVDRPLSTIATDAAEGGAALAMAGEYVVVAGHTYGSLDGANAGDADAFVRRYHSSGENQWGSQFGTSGQDFVASIAADASGNVWVAGATDGALAGWYGEHDAIVRRYGAAGQVLWTRQFGTELGDDAYGVAVDGAGNAYVVGATLGDLARDNPSVDTYDAFVRKYDANGNVLWTRQFGTSQDEVAKAVAVGPGGAVYVIGETYGSLVSPNTLVDGFVRRYSTNGAVVWTRQFGSTNAETVTGAAVDAGGGLVVTGVTIGDMAGHLGQQDAYVRRYGPGGGVSWTRQIGTADQDFGNGIAADASGNIYLTGRTNGTMAGDPSGGTDVFVMKLSSRGITRWTRQYRTSNGTQYSDPAAIAVAPSGLLYVTGYTMGSMGTGNRGGSDTFLFQLDAQGRRTWSDF